MVSKKKRRHGPHSAAKGGVENRNQKRVCLVMQGSARVLGFAVCCWPRFTPTTRERRHTRRSPHFARSSRPPDPHPAPLARPSPTMASPVPPTFHQQLPINGFPHQQHQQQPHHQQNGRTNPFTRERYQQAVEVLPPLSYSFFTLLTFYDRE